MQFDGSRLKALRTTRKWDQHRLAEAARAHGVGITQSQISRYENGQEPSGRNVLAIAAALGVEPKALYGETAEEDESLLPSPSQNELLHALHAALGAALGASQLAERATKVAA